MVKTSMNAYSRHFSRMGAAKNYVAKFTHKIDRIRHRIEVDILGKFVSGDCFDCSIGSGRFIGAFSGINSYSGMDFSEEFLAYIKNTFPGVWVKKGDLTRGIEERDEAYDTVLCMRTLFALENLDSILNEMDRITKPNGWIIWDYGVKMGSASLGGSRFITVSKFDVEKILSRMHLECARIFRLDSFFVRLIKQSSFLSRCFNSRYNIIPDSIYVIFEKIVSNVSYERKLYLIKKSNGAHHKVDPIVKTNLKRI